MKKILSLVLIISIMLLMPTTTFATGIDDETLNAAMESAIISQAIALDEASRVAGKNFKVVSLVEENDLSKDSETVGKETKAIQSVSIDDDLVAVTTILPYKCLPSGELINSFDYTSSEVGNAKFHTMTFVDVTVAVTHHYMQNSRFDQYVVNFYRHAGVEAYWTSNNTSASVSNMNVVYLSRGDLYAYPDCMSGVLNDSFISSNYEIRSEINENNPVENRVFITANHMPLDRVLVILGGATYGGSIEINLIYSVNGNSYSHYASYLAYM